MPTVFAGPFIFGVVFFSFLFYPLDLLFFSPLLFTEEKGGGE